MATNWKVGDTIKGRWEIHQILHGGMGSVYIVYDREWSEPYAVKTFQDKLLTENPRISDRFTEEAHTWINLDDHENIARARFVQQIDGKPYLFLEYVSGGDLSAWMIKNRLKNDVPLIVRFAVQFCDGMIHAISKGIQVHRDIKPQNCLITENRVLKVTDFGLAKAFDNSPAAKNPRSPLESIAIGVTQTGTAAGTCTHMAPEQFDDCKRVDTRADIYSFGITLFQMVTGILPFSGTSWMDYEHSHKCEPIPRLPSTDRDLRSILEKCMAKAPHDRFQTFAALRHELGRIFERLTCEPVPRPKLGEELGAYSLVNKGLSLSQLGRPTEALAYYDNALSLNPRIAEAWMNKAFVFGALGNHREALLCSEQSLSINPKLQQGWFNRGIALSALGKNEDAVSCFEQAHKLNLQDDTALYCWSLALSRSGRTKEALLTYGQCVKVNPENAEAWYNMGGLWRTFGNREQSLACYERATRLQPDHAKAWFNKSFTLGSMGKLEAAVEAVNHTISVTPNDADAWCMKGAWLEELHRYEEAIECFRRGEQLGQIEARQGIVNCQRKMKR
jgi:serine/threonine protein kinase